MTPRKLAVTSKTLSLSKTRDKVDAWKEAYLEIRRSARRVKKCANNPENLYRVEQHAMCAGMIFALEIVRKHMPKPVSHRNKKK